MGEVLSYYLIRKINVSYSKELMIFSILQRTQYTRQHLICTSLVDVSSSLSKQTKQT